MKRTGVKMLFLLACLAACSLLFFACAPKSDYTEDRLFPARLSAKGDSLTFDAQLSANALEAAEGRKAYLFALSPEEDASALPVMTPAAEKRAAADVSFSLKRSELKADLYSKFVLAIRRDGVYTKLGEIRYLEDPETLAPFSASVAPLSKKGLAGVKASEAEELFVSQTILDLDAAALISGSGEGTARSVGQSTYKIRGEEIARLDYEVKTLTDAGVTVMLRFSPSLEGVDPLSYGALLSYLAERYAGGENGTVSAVILAPRAPESDPAAADMLLRIFSAAIKSENAACRLFFGVSGAFHTAGGGGSAELLSSLFLLQAQNGEIPFGIAIDTEIVREETPDLWNDPKAEKTLSAEVISFSNVEILADFLSAEGRTYRGEPREILVTGLPVSTARDNETTEKKQAAAFAYAYRRLLTVPTVVGWILPTRVDTEAASNGLFYPAEEGSFPQEKPICEVFRLADTDKADVSAAPYLPLVGVGNWSSVIPGLTVPDPVYLEASLTSVSAKPDARLKTLPLFDFTGGSLCGFYPSYNARSLEILPSSEGVNRLYAVLRGGADGMAGVSAPIPAETLTGKARWLRLTLLPDSAGAAARVDLRVDLIAETDGVRTVYTSLFSAADGEESEIFVDLAGIRDPGAVKRIRVAAVNTKGMETFTLTLASAELLSSPRSVILTVLFVILILALLFGLVLLVLYLRLLLRRRKQRRKNRSMRRNYFG
ncbi:MAG: hypothetical protein IJR89_06395 [Clostridia bacterium]|nr:hypothetical protein [Clostridia bacterium]